MDFNKQRDVAICGFGDNVVDIYEHIRTMYPGGNAVNFAVYGKKAGAKRSAYMGYFGSDDRAEHVIESLEDEGIELVKCKQLLGENGFSCVSIDEEGDRIWGDFNAGGIRGESRYVLDRFDLEYLRQFDIVHSGNYCFVERQLKKMHDANILLSYDFSDDSDDEYINTWAPYVDFAFFSAAEKTEEETYELLKRVFELGPRWVCATRGKYGAYAYNGKEFFRQEAIYQPHIKDAMGAGDSFLTSFLVSYLDLLKDGLDEVAAAKESLEFAAHFASEVCCTSSGSWGHGKTY